MATRDRGPACHEINKRAGGKRKRYQEPRVVEALADCIDPVLWVWSVVQEVIGPGAE